MAQIAETDLTATHSGSLAEYSSEVESDNTLILSELQRSYDDQCMLSLGFARVEFSQITTYNPVAVFNYPIYLVSEHILPTEGCFRLPISWVESHIRNCVPSSVLGEAPMEHVGVMARDAFRPSRSFLFDAGKPSMYEVGRPSFKTMVYANSNVVDTSSNSYCLPALITTTDSHGGYNDTYTLIDVMRLPQMPRLLKMGPRALN